MDLKMKQTGDARPELHLLVDTQTETHKTSDNVGSSEIPEIKDIYDSIYGNVQNKLQFYENKRAGSVSSTPPRSISVDLSSSSENNQKIELNTSSTPSTSPSSPIFQNIPDDESTTSEEQLEQSLEAPPTPAPRKISECITNPDLLNDFSHQCTNCEKTDYIKDRSDILIEINANLKIELDCLKHDLKQEIEKNNALNFEIANIENSLETYYKEAKYQKSTLSSIYSSLKNYSGKGEEGYTYKRIKAISDYLETLKVKLQHQDRIIRENFVENPYTTDMMMKYDAVLQQLDKLGNENQELKQHLKKKADEEIEIIKELNRQKFKIEEKCKEVEVYYKKELIAKDTFIDDIQETHKKELHEIQTLLEQKVEEVAKMKKIYEAKITNSQDEVAILYRKLKNATVNKT